MIVIENRFIPFRGYKLMNVCGILFKRFDTSCVSTDDLNHERIHTRQMVELLFVGFLLYIVEWFVRLLICRNATLAYRSVSFEREAYGHEHESDYIINRRHYAFIKHFLS